MTTYIWNTEHEVMVANDEDIYNARKLLIKRVKANLDVQLKKWDELELSQGDNFESTAVETWRWAAQSAAEEQIEKLNGEPDQEVLFYDCIIYNHSNE